VISAVVLFSLTACNGDNVTSPELPQVDATSADYQLLVDESENVITAAKKFIPEGAILSEDPSVTDLETDRHRLSCSDTTSQYTNRVNIALATGIDEIAIIDEMRDSYLGEGWERGDSVSEQMGEGEDPTGRYTQSMRNPDGYGLSISRGSTVDGGTNLQLVVYSPCIGNPTDKPNRWGK